MNCRIWLIEQVFDWLREAALKGLSCAMESQEFDNKEERNAKARGQLLLSDAACFVGFNDFLS
jgi:hypothetical protein